MMLTSLLQGACAVEGGEILKAGDLNLSADQLVNVTVILHNQDILVLAHLDGPSFYP